MQASPGSYIAFDSRDCLFARPLKAQPAEQLRLIRIANEVAPVAE
jgi:hypothetical protein